MARMRTLSQKQDECSESELNQRFKSVEIQVCISTHTKEKERKRERELTDRIRKH